MEFSFNRMEIYLNSPNLANLTKSVVQESWLFFISDRFNICYLLVE